jgi:proteasome lid subunit RPN8/RPN11
VAKTEGAYAELGPLAVKLDEYRHLKEHVNVFCKGENAIELLFVITGSARIVDNRLLGEKILLMPVVHSDKQCTSVQQTLIDKLSKTVGLLAIGHVHTNTSVEPSDEDVSTSVLIDRKIGRSLYHIIMNHEAEFEIYSNREHLQHLLEPVGQLAARPP